MERRPQAANKRKREGDGDHLPEPGKEGEEQQRSVPSAGREGRGEDGNRGRRGRPPRAIAEHYGDAGFRPDGELVRVFHLELTIPLVVQGRGRDVTGEIGQVGEGYRTDAGAGHEAQELGRRELNSCKNTQAENGFEHSARRPDLDRQ